MVENCERTSRPHLEQANTRYMHKNLKWHVPHSSSKYWNGGWNLQAVPKSTPINTKFLLECNYQMSKTIVWFKQIYISCRQNTYAQDGWNWKRGSESPRASLWKVDFLTYGGSTSFKILLFTLFSCIKKIVLYCRYVGLLGHGSP